MKPSDFENARRILKLIQQLTADELTSVEIINDNPDGSPDCAIETSSYVGFDHPRSDENGDRVETFYGNTLLDCLIDAIKAHGLTEEPATEGAVISAAIRAFGILERCRAASGDRFSGGAMTEFTEADEEFELTIRKKRRPVFSFVETADSIERDRSAETPSENEIVSG